MRFSSAQLKNPEQLLFGLWKEQCERSLLKFMQHGWHVLEPAKREFIQSWALGAICEHLQAVTHGEIRRLLINVPPGFTKSLATCVFWPAWEWGPLNMPWLRSISASYSAHLAVRDSRKMKMLVTSDWYQANWGDRVRLADDLQGKGYWGNTNNGWILATSVGGIGTGERGDRFRIDDPHNVKEVESETVRYETLLWFNETVPTRLNNQSTDPIVVIMQRTHSDDVANRAIELGYTHLCLPMRYEKSRRCHVQVTGFKDRRKTEGELLDPIRFPEEVVAELEEVLGAYGTAAQLQQRPAPRGGGLFPVDKFQYLDSVPLPKDIAVSVRYWDKAGTESPTASRTAGVLMHKLKDGRFVIEDVTKGQWSSLNRETRIRAAAESDGYKVVIWVEQEPGSGGKDSAESTIRNLAGFRAYAERATGDKVTRAEPYAAQVEAGNVHLVRGSWNREFVSEHEVFPMGKFKDQVDAAAGAFNKVSGKNSRMAALASLNGASQ